MPGFSLHLTIKGKELKMTAVHHHMRLAVQADLERLFNRLPNPRIIETQLREMIHAEKRAAEYDLVPPWREKDWYGIQVPHRSDEVEKSAILVSRPTGRKAGRQKEKRK